MTETPRLVLVRGKPGSGKTTLARRLAERDALGLPLLDRDAIKVGLVATHGVEIDENRARLAARGPGRVFAGRHPRRRQPFARPQGCPGADSRLPTH